MNADSSSPGDVHARMARVAQVVENTAARRSGGEDLSDEIVIAAHANLMPELGAMLRDLVLVEQARRLARVADAEACTEVRGKAETDGDALQAVADALSDYRIVRELHRGGQGVVYQAIRKSTKRKVAIKVMREGPFAGPRDKARFEREVEILALLDHPNIVGIHDRGQAAGCFYFVMDYIAGRTLDAHMAESDPPREQTLDLFAKICDAVNAAHLNGVIHRDLKPANIRVDHAGAPHVLDFGLAKVLGGDVTEVTGQFVGSLPWSSPEQAEGSAGKIDVRTDVYSLGVILYELLTGKFPYDVSGSVADVLDNVRNTEPTRPRAICPSIDDELATIVLKCLAKDRERRYQSAGELARDIRRYIADEPIEAKRDSGWYVLRKTLRRHRAPVAVAAAFVVLICVFGATMTLMYGRATGAERRAEKRARIASLYGDFLDETLSGVNPGVAPGLKNVAFRQLLDRAARRLTELADEPEAEAAVRTTIGKTYVRLGRYDDARLHLRLALDARRDIYGNEHPEVAECLHYLAWALTELQEYDAAEKLYREALALRERLFGEQSLEAAATLNDLGVMYTNKDDYGAAEPPLRRALEIRRASPGVEQADLVESLATVGMLLFKKGDPDGRQEAETLLRESYQIARRELPEHPSTVSVMNQLALVLRDRREFAEAEALFRNALELRRKLLPETHPYIAVSCHNLALSLRAQGKYAEAIELHHDAINLWKAALGGEHPNVAAGLKNLAKTLRVSGDVEQAEARCREALRISETADARYVLGRILMEAGDPGAAEHELRASLDRFVQRDPEHWRRRRGQSALGGCLVTLARYDEAEPLLAEGYARLRDSRGNEDEDTVAALRWLIALYEATDNADQADKYRALLPGTGEASAEAAP